MQNHTLEPELLQYAGDADVVGLFSNIAERYDFLNHLLSAGLDIIWRKSLVRSMRSVPEGVLLDLAAGTLDVSLDLSEAYPERTVLAGDFCLPMLVRGKEKAARKRRNPRAISRIFPLAADAFSLPLPDASVAGITVSFGLRNMVPNRAALSEMYRVLKPGGRLSVLEFGSARKKVWLGLYNFYLAKVLPKIGGILSGERDAYEYLARTIYNFPYASVLKQKMHEVGFFEVSYKKLSGGIVYLHSADKA